MRFRSKLSSSTNRRFRTMRNTTAVLRKIQILFKNSINNDIKNSFFVFNCFVCRLQVIEFLLNQSYLKNWSVADTNVEMVCKAGKRGMLDWKADIVFERKWKVKVKSWYCFWTKMKRLKLKGKCQTRMYQLITLATK